MLNALVAIISGGINFQTVTVFILIYCASIWVLLCFWVFLDAKRRYNKFFAGLAFFIIVLIFNFPGLIFYLIIRPDKTEDNFFYLQNDGVTEAQESRGGIDIPIVNFVNENGEVNLSFQLKVNKNSGISTVQVGNSQPNESLKVKVDVPKVEVAQISTPKMDQPVVEVKEEENKGSRKFSVSLSSLKSKFSKNNSDSIQTSVEESKESQEKSPKKNKKDKKKKKRNR